MFLKGGIGMYSIFSDSGSWIIVFDGEEDEPEELTVSEFIERYGEENLPERFDASSVSDVFDAGGALDASDASDATTVAGGVSEKQQTVQGMQDATRYYAAFKRLIEACGKYASADKMGKNDAEGVFQVQKVVYDTFGSNGRQKLATETERRRLTQKVCAKKLNYWSQKVGFLPMREVDLEVLMKHLYKADFRSRMKYRIDKYEKKGELVSTRDLVIQVMQSFLKQRKLP